MTKKPISLQDLRRRLYDKAKAEPSWRLQRQGFGWKRWRQRSTLPGFDVDLEHAFEHTAGEITVS
jgi:hypothetical protein